MVIEDKHRAAPGGDICLVVSEHNPAPLLRGTNDAPRECHSKLSLLFFLPNSYGDTFENMSTVQKVACKFIF